LAQSLPAVILKGLAAVIFIRRLCGGLFSVKVAAVKRKANQSLSATPMEHDITTTKGRDKALHLLPQGKLSNSERTPPFIIIYYDMRSY